MYSADFMVINQLTKCNTRALMGNRVMLYALNGPQKYSPNIEISLTLYLTQYFFIQNNNIAIIIKTFTTIYQLYLTFIYNCI